MWSTNSIWFELFIFSTFLLFGNILMGHFEERTSRYRRVIKTVIIMGIYIIITLIFGRIIAFIILGLSLIPIIIIHAILLPRKGINGWTGEPKEKYYEFRGWDKNIFKKK